MDAADAYLATLDEPRRSEVAELHALITATLPDLAVEASPSGGLGYGPFHYRYATGREGDAHQVQLTSRKTGISLYVLAVDGDEYVTARYAERLGKASVGKSCVKIKRLTDVDRDVLRELLADAGRHAPPGTT